MINLKTKLSYWLNPPTDKDQFLYSPSLNRVFIKHNHLWIQYRKKLNKFSQRNLEGRFIEMEQKILSHPILQDAQRATITTIFSLKDMANTYSKTKRTNPHLLENNFITYAQKIN